MTIKIKIQNLKSIDTLDFELPPPGVYLLTGINGSGKTSLLGCINRLGDPSSFQRVFRRSSHEQLDQFGSAEVTYSINGTSVAYKYTAERTRWEAHPRTQGKLLQTAGYSEVVHIAADGKRIEPKENDFNPRKVKAAPSDLKDALNSIFETTRFGALHRVNLVGRDRHAYLIRYERSGRANYYSEINFSLGELCVLKLVLTLLNLKNNSLVLIDELELALHPRAQIKLFEYLQKFIANKQITILFSTHSVSLIKSAPRAQILYLDRVGNNVQTLRGCYPTFVLGQLAAEEESAPDNVIFVEDFIARTCVESLLGEYRSRKSNEIHPTAVVAAMGGFGEILRFLDRAPKLFASTTSVKAALDGDVQTDSLTDYQNRGDFEMLSLFDRQKDAIHFLPWTPEVGLVQLIASDANSVRTALRNKFSDHRIQLNGAPFISCNNKTGAQQRSEAKPLIAELATSIAELQGMDKGRVYQALFQLLATSYFTNNTQSAMRLTAGLLK